MVRGKTLGHNRPSAGDEEDRLGRFQDGIPGAVEGSLPRSPYPWTPRGVSCEGTSLSPRYVGAHEEQQREDREDRRRAFVNHPDPTPVPPPLNP